MLLIIKGKIKLLANGFPNFIKVNFFQLGHFDRGNHFLTGYVGDLILEQTGKVQCLAGNNYQIHPSSRVGWWGCWLILVNNQVGQQAAKKVTYFIFAEQCSSRDYARLCRTILRNKTLKVVK